jgi:hypothetical protein
MVHTALLRPPDKFLPEYGSPFRDDEDFIRKEPTILHSSLVFSPHDVLVPVLPPRYMLELKLTHLPAVYDKQNDTFVQYSTEIHSLVVRTAEDYDAEKPAHTVEELFHLQYNWNINSPTFCFCSIERSGDVWRIR